MSGTIRDEFLTQLEDARQLVERRVRPDGEYDGWSGKDVLTHLGAYARLIAAMLRAEAERRQATDAELYGRELTAAERALGGLDEVNEAIRREYETLSYDEAVALWRTMHAEVIAQFGRLTNAQLAAPGPTYPAHWSRPELVDVVGALIHHYHGHMAEN
jgi:hypothetical protein